VLSSELASRALDKWHAYPPAGVATPETFVHSFYAGEATSESNYNLWGISNRLFGAVTRIYAARNELIEQKRRALFGPIQQFIPPPIALLVKLFPFRLSTGPFIFAKPRAGYFRYGNSFWYTALFMPPVLTELLTESVDTMQCV
jgi:hypothetical protein